MGEWHCLWVAKLLHLQGVNASQAAGSGADVFQSPWLPHTVSALQSYFGTRQNLTRSLGLAKLKIRCIFHFRHEMQA